MGTFRPKPVPKKTFGHSRWLQHIPKVGQERTAGEKRLLSSDGSCLPQPIVSCVSDVWKILAKDRRTNRLQPIAIAIAVVAVLAARCDKERSKREVLDNLTLFHISHSAFVAR